MFNSLRNQAPLVMDSFRSFLRVHGKLKRKKVSYFEYKTSSGTRFKLRKEVSDSAVILENWWLKLYFQKIKDIKQNPTIIDIGSHIGSFTLLAAEKYKDAKIYAFEPNPENFALLKQNIKLNHLEKRVFAFNLAVSVKTGLKLRLYSHPDNTGMNSSVLLDKKSHFPYHDVSTISLEDIFKKNNIKTCDVMKVDCEGCEYALFATAPAPILKKIRRITLEYHIPGDINGLEQKLKKTGFKTLLYYPFASKIMNVLLRIPMLYAEKI